MTITVHISLITITITVLELCQWATVAGLV